MPSGEVLGIFSESIFLGHCAVPIVRHAYDAAIVRRYPKIHEITTIQKMNAAASINTGMKRTNSLSFRPRSAASDASTASISAGASSTMCLLTNRRIRSRRICRCKAAWKYMRGKVMRAPGATIRLTRCCARATRR